MTGVERKIYLRKAHELNFKEEIAKGESLCKDLEA